MPPIEARLTRVHATTWGIVATNVVPLLGVVALGWQAPLVLYGFLVDALVVAMFAFAEIRVALGRKALAIALPIMGIPMVLFAAIQVAIITGVFHAPEAQNARAFWAAAREAWWASGLELSVLAVLALLAHGRAFTVHTLRNRAWSARHYDGTKAMARALRTGYALQFAVVVGAFAMDAAHGATAAVAALVIAKAILDLVVRERKPLQTGADVAHS